MIETLKIAFTGINALPSALLILSLVYWITLILGFIDFDFFDLDLDIDSDMEADGEIGDAPGFLHSVLAFLNVGYVPLMVVLSILVLYFWILSMTVNMLPVEKGGMICTLLLAPNFLISMFLTKLTTNPLKKLFRDILKINDTGAVIINKECTLITDLEMGKLGQAEIADSGKHLVINVKTDTENSFKKGEKALIRERDKEKDFYFIEKI